MAVMEKQLTLDAGAATMALMGIQFSTPARASELVGELDALYDSLYVETIGTLTVAEQPHKGPVNVATAAWRIRRDRVIAARLGRILTQYPARLTRKVQAMQDRMYRETVRNIAKIWNAYTAAGVTIKGKATAADLDSIHASPVNGLLVNEWAKLSGAALRGKVLAALTMRRAREKGGVEAGHLRAVKRIKLAIEQQKKDMAQVAEHAVNAASAVAFEQESGLFEGIG